VQIPQAVATEQFMALPTTPASLNISKGGGLRVKLNLEKICANGYSILTYFKPFLVTCRGPKYLTVL
jgi:hypothetical protein